MYLAIMKQCEKDTKKLTFKFQAHTTQNDGKVIIEKLSQAVECQDCFQTYVAEIEFKVAVRQVEEPKTTS